MMVWLLSIGAVTILLFIASKVDRSLRLVSEAALGAAIAGAPFALVSFSYPLLAIAALILHLWLIVLPARLIMGRLERQFLLRSTWQNALIGAGVCFVLAATQMWQPQAIVHYGLIFWFVGCIVAGIYFLGQLWWNTRRYKIPALLTHPRSYPN